MAAKPTLLLSPDGSFDDNGRVEPTLTGGVLVVPGQYGNAWQLAEATMSIRTLILDEVVIDGGYSASISEDTFDGGTP